MQQIPCGYVSIEIPKISDVHNFPNFLEVIKNSTPSFFFFTPFDHMAQFYFHSEDQLVSSFSKKMAPILS